MRGQCSTWREAWPGVSTPGCPDQGWGHPGGRHGGWEQVGRSQETALLKLSQTLSALQNKGSSCCLPLPLQEEQGWGERGGAKKPEQSCHLTRAQQWAWRPQACHPGCSSEPGRPGEEAAKHCLRRPKPSSTSYLPLTVPAIRTGLPRWC